MADLPDPSSRYKAAVDSRVLNDSEIDVPLVYNTDGSLIHPAKYRDTIQDGALAIVHSILKVCEFTTRCPSLFMTHEISSVVIISMGMDSEL